MAYVVMRGDDPVRTFSRFEDAQDFARRESEKVDAAHWIFGLDPNHNRENAMKKFWLVWNEKNTAPTKKHWSDTEACAEAKRLALKHPGETFHVLVLVDSCTKREVHWASDFDQLPF